MKEIKMDLFGRKKIKELETELERVYDRNSETHDERAAAERLARQLHHEVNELRGRLNVINQFVQPDFEVDVEFIDLGGDAHPLARPAGFLAKRDQLDQALDSLHRTATHLEQVRER